jgi:hypothetical protein
VAQQINRALVPGGVFYFDFDETDPADRSLIEYLFNIDRVLCQSGRIRPNFTMTLAVKR